MSGEFHHSHSKWVDERISLFLEEKAGLLGSGSAAGQAIQGVASVAIPGDMSDVRSPVRSTIFETLTPGGVGGLRRPRAGREVEYRCPEGYQFGGRFTDSKWSTCGRQLFDIPSLARTLAQIADALISGGGNAGYQKPSMTTLRGAEVNAQVIQSRAASIPRVGAIDKKRREDGLRIAVDELMQNPSLGSMMIRRDGFPMQPVVSVAELRKVPDNRNMEDAVFLIQAANIDSFGRDELGLLSNTGVTTLVYVTPNGSTIRMDRTRPLTVGERRKLGKTVSAASQMDVDSDPLARLRSVVTESDGAISLKEDFSKIRNADDIIESGDNQGKKRWVIEAFKPSSSKRRVTPAEVANNAKPSASTEARATRKISSIDGAVEHINDGGNLSDIDPSVLMEAIKRSRVYKTRKLSGGKTLFERNDGGVPFVAVEDGKDFEHLGAHFSSAMLEHLELPSPKVRIAGEGNSRPYLVQTAESVLPNGKPSRSNLADLPAKDLTGILVSDYLSDVRKRNPSTIQGISTDNKIQAVVSMNAPSAFAGLSVDEIKKRRNIGPDEFMNGDGKAITDALAKRSEETRRQILAVYEALIQRARAFNWDSYISALRADGKLSSAEQRHMDIVKSIFELRLDRLATSKQAFTKLLGIGK